MKNIRSITALIFPLFVPVMLFTFSKEYSAHASYNETGHAKFASMIPVDTEKHIPPVLNPAPAPGTAVILADSSVVHHDYLTVRVVRVMGYGSATPALPAGARIDLLISGALLRKRSLADICDGINSGKADTLIVHYSALMGLGTNDKHWTLYRTR